MKRMLLARSEAKTNKSQTSNHNIIEDCPLNVGSKTAICLFCALLTGISTLFMQCKSSENFNTTASLSPYLIACDTITVNDSSFYEPVFFRIKDKTIVHTTSNNDEFYFDIIEIDSVKTSAKVFFTCNELTYDVTMKIEKGGYLNFYQPKKTTRFRILNVVKLRL